MMKPPTNIPCQFESTPAISSELRITKISAEPIKAPKARAFAAHQVGPADHRRRDRQQFIGLAEAVVGRARPADAEDRGERRRHRAQDIGLHLDAADRNAGQIRRLLVAADRENMPPPAGSS